MSSNFYKTLLVSIVRYRSSYCTYKTKIANYATHNFTFDVMNPTTRGWNTGNTQTKSGESCAL